MANPRGNPQNFRPPPKGVSRNPSGKPKDTEHVRALARENTRVAMNTLISIARDGKAPAAARVSASTVILERGWGKPLQQVEVKRSPLDGLTTEQLVGALATVEKAIETAGGDQEKLVAALASLPVSGNA